MVCVQVSPWRIESPGCHAMGGIPRSPGDGRFFLSARCGPTAQRHAAGDGDVPVRASRCCSFHVFHRFYLVSTFRFSGCCCFAASGALSHCPPPLADVAIHSTTLATTGQRVRRREFWVGEALHLRVLPRECAGKLGAGSHSTCGSVISNCLRGAPMTRDVLRSLQTDDGRPGGRGGGRACEKTQRDHVP